MFPQAQARRNYKFIYAKQCFPAQIAPTGFFYGYRQNMVILDVGEGFLCQSRPSLQERRESLLLPSTQMLVDQGGGSTVFSISTEKNLDLPFLQYVLRSTLWCHHSLPITHSLHFRFLLQLTQNPECLLHWGYTRELRNTSKQTDHAEFDRHEFPLFFFGGGELKVHAKMRN